MGFRFWRKDPACWVTVTRWETLLVAKKHLTASSCPSWLEAGTTMQGRRMLSRAGPLLDVWSFPGRRREMPKKKIIIKKKITGR